MSELIRDVPVAGVRGDPTSTAITGVELDSRIVSAGTLFCCVPGANVDGHRFADEAVERGASALLCEHLLDVDVTQIAVGRGEIRPAMASVAAAFYGHPSLELTTVGVTGTNGKTTVTRLVAGILERSGVSTGVIGTLGGPRTTPESPELQRRLAELRREGRQAVALEVSSHALSQHRVDEIDFDVAAFTNLSRDHLDHHGTMEEYFAAKARLFEPGRCRVAVIDVDDPWGRRLAERTAAQPVADHASGHAIGHASGHAIGHASGHATGRDPVRPRLVPVRRAEATEIITSVGRTVFQWRGRTVDLPLTGTFNVANALVAATVAVELGIDEQTVVEGLTSAEPVPGRMEVVADRPVAVVVDYAHTPAGLEAALGALRDATGPAGHHRLICVFGCGGDRDRGKRPLMGSVASRLSDVVVLTSDNPRSEDPGTIIEQVRGGADGQARVLVEPDRSEAVLTAVVLADDGDIVLIAGKGHEITQTAGDSTVPFDDRVVASAALSARAGTLPR